MPWRENQKHHYFTCSKKEAQQPCSFKNKLLISLQLQALAIRTAISSFTSIKHTLYTSIKNPWWCLLLHKDVTTKSSVGCSVDLCSADLYSLWCLSACCHLGVKCPCCGLKPGQVHLFSLREHIFDSGVCV